ncbi:hypothetical protein [Singulisphaera sp. PoT]|uniref:hypothetical protein n=1 Tax=Singulisphaera sp. PoT TaxID=3411797 RepID=UPI003BF54B34
MRTRQKWLPLLFLVIGLFGISLFFIASRYMPSIVPKSDFGKGLWFGICLGFEVLAGMIALKAKSANRPGTKLHAD